MVDYCLNEPDEEGRRRCRHEYLLAYFGESLGRGWRCGCNCDTCLQPPEAAEEDIEDESLSNRVARNRASRGNRAAGPSSANAPPSVKFMSASAMMQQQQAAAPPQQPAGPTPASAKQRKPKTIKTKATKSNSSSMPSLHSFFKGPSNAAATPAANATAGPSHSHPHPAMQASFPGPFDALHGGAGRGSAAVQPASAAAGGFTTAAAQLSKRSATMLAETTAASKRKELQLKENSAALSWRPQAPLPSAGTPSSSAPAAKPLPLAKRSLSLKSMHAAAAAPSSAPSAIARAMPGAASRLPGNSGLSSSKMHRHTLPPAAANGARPPGFQDVVVLDSDDTDD